MSFLVADLSIWILLLAGVGFGGIGLIGLLLFPDTRSRMYTSVRATLISIGALALVSLLYAVNALQTTGGNQYLALILHTLLLIGVVIIANIVVSAVVLDKIQLAGTCCNHQEPAIENREIK
jgi:multicomponent Na+:H+ antiporter subunit G